ncbi:MAG TPA: DUF2889 domain-containing protein [Bacteroidia bacterium]|nr:DUF2889 domain-containing protein [Bacteroidia bacterium]
MQLNDKLPINSNIENNSEENKKIPVKRLVSKRDIGIEAFELVNNHLLLESTLLDPYHLIKLIIQINPHDKKIVFAQCEFSNYPHSLCSLMVEKAKLLIGLKIERGISKQIIHKIGGSEGCVHLKELALETINFAATVLIGYDQGFGLMSREFNLLHESKKYEIAKDVLRNTCFVYKSDRHNEK